MRSRREERPKLPLSLEVDILLQSGILSRQASLPEPKAAASRPHYKKSMCGVLLWGGGVRDEHGPRYPMCMEPGWQFSASDAT